MPEAGRGNVIFDTTIYYKDAERVQGWLDENDYVVYFTPNNALELMTPKAGSAGSDFAKRKQAISNLLALTNDGERALLDTEQFQAVRLGFDAIDSGPWAEAARRFLALDEFTADACKEAGIDLKPACDAIEFAYGTFVKKVETCQGALQDMWNRIKDAWKELGLTYDDWRSLDTIQLVMRKLGAEDDVLLAQVERISKVAEELPLKGTMVDPAQYRSAFGVYVRTYLGYIRYALCTGKRDKNDFGDLQFFAYCDGGYRLVSSEGRWHEISVQEGLEEHLIYYI